MDRIQLKKTERSKAKQAVTLVSRRLTGAIRRKEDEESLNCLVLELEKVYDDFCSVNEEFEVLVADEEFAEHRVVNGQDIDTYLAHVRQIYEDANAEMEKLKENRLQMVHDAQVVPIKLALTRSILKIRELISEIQENLDQDIPQVETLKQDKYELEGLSDEIWDNMCKLSIVKGEDEVQQEVNAIQRVVCSLKRNINKCLSKPIKAQDVPEPMFSFKGLNTEFSNVGPMPGVSHIQSTPIASHLSMSSPSTVPTFPPSTQGSTQQLPVNNFSWPPPLEPEIPSDTYAIKNTGYPVSSNQNMSSTGTVPSFPVSGPGSTQQVAGIPYSNLTWSTPFKSDAQTDSHFTRVPGYPGTPPPLVTPAQWSPKQDFTSGGGTYIHGTSGFSSASKPTATDIRLKKISLPTFSGLRKDWPEFKTVWKQLAESAYTNQTALAHELKRSVKGEASLRIKSVYVTKPEAYEIMWKKLEAYYEDPSASVQAALDDLSQLRPVKGEDYKGLVALVDEVESTYSQLEELNNLDTLTMRDVDFVSNLLPSHLRVDWARKYHDLSPREKLHPFTPFMTFLEREREAVTRLAEKQPSRGRLPEMSKQTVQNKGQSHQSHHTESTTTTQAPRQYYKCAFPNHRKDAVKHCTEECKEFQKLPLGGKEGKFEMLKQVNACFLCFGDHKRNVCPNKKTCSKCGSDKHHVILCKSDKQEEVTKSSSQSQVKGDSNVSQRDYLALYPIQQAKVCGTDKSVTVFCDSGSNTTYITHKAADKIKAQRLNKYTLDVTTMGDIETTYDTVEYQFTLKTNNGKKVEIRAYGMERITGPVSRLDLNTVAELFPEFESESLQRKSTEVDILLGCDYFGLHPKKEEAACGDNLSVMSGEFGICLQGTHPRLKEETVIDSNLAKIVHSSKIKTGSHHACLLTHEEFQPNPLVRGDVLHAVNRETHKETVNVANAVGEKKRELQVENFIRGEELGTETTPRCGGCRCNKCPTVGHTYSFKEEQELNMIRENLEYDEERQCWITSYPWLTDPSTLPNNYDSTFATLKNTENTLSKDKKWAETYQQQMQDMVDRGVARKLSSEENKEWQGPVFYISHLAVVNPRSHSTPVRIVFNSSQVSKGMSLNSCLAKGPDSYMNNLLGILLRWREEQVAVVGDIKKMFNSVLLKPLEQHCHRFLWRDMKMERVPDEYVIQRVNMGDKPAPAISTEALYKTADRFEDESPAAANLLKKSSYVDDLVDSFPTKSEALAISREVESMLSKGGFKIKCWQFSGESSVRNNQELQQDELVDYDTGTLVKKSRLLLKGTEESLRVLGVGWDPVEDTIVYEVNLNFSKKKKGVHVGPDLSRADVPQAIPSILTRRIVLGQVMKIYDPLGLVCPFTLYGKIYLRETWSQNLGWDEPLPDNLRDKWIRFFNDMFTLEQLKLNRCIRPSSAVGLPWLIILSDGSDLAYGFAAYARWKLEDDNFCCQLIMAKCRIAPMSKLSTPQMELNAAVMSKRGRKVLEKELRLKFQKVLQIVDSETVLSMINKTSTRFKVYEGVRIGEIQAATEGDMSCWAWMSGKDNTADWLTRGRSPAELDSNSEWWNGPSVLSKPIEEWGLKFGLQKEGPLPGEKKICSTTAAEMSKDRTLIDYKRFSNIHRALRVVARLQGMARKKSFSGGDGKLITAQDLKEAENRVVKDIQKSIRPEMMKTDRKGRKGGRYSRLQPVQDEDGFWVVGRRLMKFNAMMSDSSLQKLLPTCHPGTRLFMVRAHHNGHRGRDATLAMFRQHYWVPHGSNLAKSVRQNCQLCKLRDVKLLTQEMGVLPDARLKPAPAFNSVMIDLFGPYTVRGEVQKRISGKAYGVIFTDLVMRAVHIEAVYGYDTSSFLLALSRFASLRGWPETIYSDPGSQLVGAEKELKDAWNKIDRDVLQKDAASHGTTWVFGPADSPWYQGAVESLVKSAKRAIHFTMHNQRLSVPEFLTLCIEVTNLLNERPIGSLPSVDSELNILTPNSLLLGRATAVNPRGWQPQGSNLVTRYRIVQALTDEFWKKWTELYAPTLVVQKKWNTSCRNLKPGDVVIVADRNTLRGEYRLAEVKEVSTSEDGKVRQVKVRYKANKVGEKRSNISQV